MANNIIKYKGNQIGKSIKEENDNIILPGFIEKISYSGREAVYHVRVNDDVRLLVNIYCPDELSIDEISSQVELEISKNDSNPFKIGSTKITSKQL